MKKLNKNSIGPKGKDLTKFVRFGGLNIKKQKGFGKNNTFHSPPVSKGFYAFPKIAQELFLISSMDVYQPYTMPKYIECNANCTKEEQKLYNDNYDERIKNAKSLMRKEFNKNTGTIWSHLTDYIKHNEILDSNGSWIKTSVKEWQRAFNKMSIKFRMTDDQNLRGNNINNVYGIVGYFPKDHCEVFFDEKI